MPQELTLLPLPRRALTVWLSIAALGCVKRPLPEHGLAAGPRTGTLDVWRPGPDAPKLYVAADLGDGEPRMFMVDTGAGISALTEDAAEALGLTPTPQQGFVAGLGGRVQGWSAVRVDEVGLGPHTVRGVDFAVGIPGVPDRAGLVPVDGILGNNVWQHFQLAIDYPANTLRLTRAGEGPPLEDGVPMYLARGHARIAVELLVEDPSAPDGVRSQPWELEVDTGAVDVVLAGRPPQAAEDLHTLASTGIEPIFGIGADDTLPLSSFLRQTRRLPLKGVRVGDLTIEEARSARWVDFEPTERFAPPDMPGLLGHHFLDDHVLVIDYPSRRLALRASDSEPEVHDLHEWQLDRLKRAKSPEDIRQRAILLAVLERVDEARRLLEGHLSTTPDDTDAIVLLARLERADGATDAAEARLAQLSVGELVDAGEIVASVNGLWLRGKRAAALDLAWEATRARPTSPGAWVALADAATTAGDHSTARRALREANTLSDSPDGQLLRRAWVAVAEDDLASALTHLRRRLELLPNGAFTPWLYAWTAKDAEDALQQAVAADLTRALARLHPGDGPLDFYAAGWRLLGDMTAAEALQAQGEARDCDRAPEGASQDNCTAWYNGLLGESLDESWTAIQGAVESDPGRSEYLDTLAVVAEARGELDAARTAALAAARLSPDDVYLLWQVRRLGAVPAEESP